jgi:acyl carrier protein
MEMTIFKETACNGLYQILVWKLGIFPRKIYPDSALRKDLGLDAVDMEDLSEAIETKFKIDRIETFRALASDIEVEALADFIAEKLHGFTEREKPAE